MSDALVSDTSRTASSSPRLTLRQLRFRPVVLSLLSAALLCLITLSLYEDGHRHVKHLASSLATCPDPSSWLRLPIDQPLEDVDLWYGDHQPLQSSDAQFAIALSTSLHQPCNSFAIDIRRTDEEVCKLAESRTNMTTDADVLRYLKEELGPDTFMLRVSGGQRWASELPRYLGNCRWRFDVSLSNGGDVFLELWHTYTDYKSLDEADTSEWIDYTRTSLLDQPLTINLCPSRCKTTHYPRHDLFLIKSHVSDPTFSGVLPCGNATLSGVWLPWHPIDQMYPPAPIIPPRKGSAPLMGQYHFQPDGCHLYHAGNQFLDDHSKCTVREGGEKWNVMFLGDSHMRFVLHSWQYRLAGHTDYYPEKEKPQWMKSVSTYNDSSYHFNWAPYAKDWHMAVQAEDLEDMDAIVASYSAWPAMDGITAAEYISHLTHGLDVIDRHATSRLTRKVWLTSAPFPPWTKPNRKERRTNAQLAYWNRVTKRMLRERGWMVVDQFELGMPLVLEMAAGDGVHLSPSDAHAVIVDDVLAKAGICPV